MGVDDRFEIGGEGLVDLSEVGGVLDVVFIFWLAVGEAARVLIFGGQGEELIAKGGVGAGAVSGDKFDPAMFQVLLGGAWSVGRGSSLGGKRGVRGTGKDDR